MAQHYKECAAGPQECVEHARETPRAGTAQSKRQEAGIFLEHGRQESLGAHYFRTI